MEQNYDFSHIGKQMPYTVPDGFFDELEENVMKELKESSAPAGESRKARIVRMTVRAVIAVAACIALLFIVKKALPHHRRLRKRGIGIQQSQHRRSGLPARGISRRTIFR